MAGRVGATFRRDEPDTRVDARRPWPATCTPCTTPTWTRPRPAAGRAGPPAAPARRATSPCSPSARATCTSRHHRGAAGPQGQEVELADALGPCAWRLRFFDPVIVPGPRPHRRDRRAAARADPRRARRAARSPTTCRSRRAAASRAHHALHAGTGLAHAHAAAHRDFDSIAALAPGREDLVAEMRGASVAGLPRRPAPAGSRASPRAAGDLAAMDAARRRPGRACAVRCWPTCAEVRVTDDRTRDDGRRARGATPALDPLERAQRRTAAQGVLARQPRDRRHRAVAPPRASARAPRTACSTPSPRSGCSSRTPTPAPTGSASRCTSSAHPCRCTPTCTRPAPRRRPAAQRDEGDGPGRRARRPRGRLRRAPREPADAAPLRPRRASQRRALHEHRQAAARLPARRIGSRRCSTDGC